MDFLSSIAWPLVALIGLIILGPGGVLQKIVGELTENIFKITQSVKDFKETAEAFHKTQRDLSESIQWVSQFDIQLQSLHVKIENINSITQQLAISEGNRSLERVVGDDGVKVADEQVSDGKSADEMFSDIRIRWDKLMDRLRSLVGDQFDGRSVGQTARRLVDKRRTKQLKPTDADLFEQLHSQIKRFNYMQNTKNEWLTHETYSAFIRGIEQAEAALS